MIPSERGNILEFNQYIKSDKMPYIYADIVSLVRKIDGCAINWEKSSTTKLGEHIPFGYSMSTIWPFDHIKNKHTLYCGKDCMKKFCCSIREHATDLLIFEKRERLLLTKRIRITPRCNKLLHLQKKNLKKYQKWKLEIIVIIQENIEVQHIVFAM